MEGNLTQSASSNQKSEDELAIAQAY